MAQGRGWPKAGYPPLLWVFCRPICENLSAFNERNNKAGMKFELPEEQKDLGLDEMDEYVPEGGLLSPLRFFFNFFISSSFCSTFPALQWREKLMPDEKGRKRSGR